MAWVKQTFTSGLTEVHLLLRGIVIRDETDGISFEPKTKTHAHNLALMLRRAARRLEEIGKELP